MALATANRSPDGRPPSDSWLGDADVALGEQRAQHRGEVRPRRAAAQPEQRDPGRVDRGADRRRHRHRRPQDQAGRARAGRARPAAPTIWSGSSTPTPRTSASRGSTGSSTGSWMTTPPISSTRSASPWTRSSSVAPRSSRTRPRLARGRGFEDRGHGVQHSRTVGGFLAAYFVASAPDRGRRSSDQTGQSDGEPLGRDGDRGELVVQRHHAEAGPGRHGQVAVVEHERRR